MTKSNLIYYVVNNWSNNNDIKVTFEQQQKLVKELCKHLMLKKIRK